MTDSGWLFLNTPLPYLGAMYFLAYRHDLGRIARPFRDLSDSSEWHAVFKRLDLAGTGLKSPKRPLLGGTRNLVLAVASIAIYVVSIFTSFFLAWYYPCAIQAAVAVPLFILLVTNRTGPFPFRPTRTSCPILVWGPEYEISAEGRSRSPTVPTSRRFLQQERSHEREEGRS
ncbi:MAG: hypothetical protein JRN16_05445 [Nitrososphaerota archaeon]|nr:hypothetical protein [Nitrososphaerota archaeon]MDG7027833.1 hypothetical protein [Nitrososphaerota archaeon]